MLSGDVAAAIGELKARPEANCRCTSGALIRWLMRNDLVDEMNLLTVPVVVGQGTCLFSDTGPERAFELLESQTTPGGVDHPGLPAEPARGVRSSPRLDPDHGSQDGR